MKIIEKIKKRRRLVVALLLMLLILHQKTAAAAFWGGGGSSGESIIDRIIDAIGDFFRSIIDGFKGLFNTIIKAIEWPFAQLKYMFTNVYNWSWTHLGPLGVVVFVAIAGMTAYVAIFWFKQNVQQVKNW